MRSRVIVDTGPIVGLIRADDQWSKWSSELARTIAAPYLTCEAVVLEASFILEGFFNGREQLLELIEEGILQIDFSLSSNVSAIKSLMSKYSDLPMSLTDACLVRMSELYEDAAVFTVDQDFLIYRKHGRKKIPLISPF